MTSCDRAGLQAFVCSAHRRAPERLSAIALADRQFITRPEGRPEFADRRVAVVLAQGGAMHYSVSRICLSVSRFAATADLTREAAKGATRRSGPDGWRFMVLVRAVALPAGSSR